MDRDEIGIASAIEEAVERVAVDAGLQAKLDAAIEELRTGTITLADRFHQALARSTD